MKAILYPDWGRLCVAEVPTPSPGCGEILVQVEACGICGSELETFRTRSPRRTPPLIMGHEFCGRVAMLGEGVADGLKVGQPVVVNSVQNCGTCSLCRRGQTHLCCRREVFGMHRPGAWAEYVVADRRIVYPRPETLSAEAGALVEPAANAVHVMRLLPELEKQTVLILGAGAIGLMILQAAKTLCGARTAVSEPNSFRRKAAETLGADLLIDPTQEDPVAVAKAFSESDGVDYVVDAVGMAATKRGSVAACRPGGGVCWIGLYEDEVSLSGYDVTLLEKTITGSYSATEEDFLLAIRLLAEGKITGDSWVKVFDLRDAVTGFERMLQAKDDDIKAIIRPEGKTQCLSR